MRFSGAPWYWPPTVTREQTWRDIQLLLDALDDGGELDF